MKFLIWKPDRRSILKKKHISLILIMFAVLLCVSGYLFGDVQAIVRKAIIICLECIGVG